MLKRCKFTKFLRFNLVLLFLFDVFGSVVGVFELKMLKISSNAGSMEVQTLVEGDQPPPVCWAELWIALWMMVVGLGTHIYIAIKVFCCCCLNKTNAGVRETRAEAGRAWVRGHHNLLLAHSTASSEQNHLVFHSRQAKEAGGLASLVRRRR